MNNTDVIQILRTVKPYTLVGSSRLMNNIQCVSKVVQEGIVGDIVEIGVWKGGSMMAMIMAAEVLKSPRTFHLYDTFEGMTPPCDADRTVSTDEHFTSWMQKAGDFYLCISHLEEVKQNVKTLGVSPERILYHKGDICKNTFVPEKIAVLRLDTDFYESTKHELATFYDSVVPGGFVIIDDYGFWKGSRQAVDEWLVTHPEIKLQEIDGEGVYFRKAC